MARTGPTATQADHRSASRSTYDGFMELAVLLLVVLACTSGSTSEPLVGKELAQQTAFFKAFVTSHTCIDLFNSDQFRCTQTMSPALFGGSGVEVTYEIGAYDESVDPDRGPNNDAGDALFGNLARPLVEERIVQLYEWNLEGWPARTSEACDPSIPQSVGAPVWEPGFAASGLCGKWLASGIDQFLSETD